MSHEFLVHYADEDGTLRLGLEREAGLYGLNIDLQMILHTSLKDLPSTVEKASSKQPISAGIGELEVPPMVEVWAAGVTYKISEEARERESGNSTIYTRVYDAERPELFHKAVGYDVMQNGDPVGIRYDSTWSVPEPELCIVLNSRMQVLGFTIGNDMSSRDIEGENPLYLPQAKNYYGACAIGPRIWLQPGAAEYPTTDIDITIRRDGADVFNGQTSTTNLHRPLPMLVDYLGRCKPFNNGVFLMTGTGVVPPDNFTLESGDTVHIRIDPIGELVNPVRTVQRLI
jgi:2-dehydro-3-deoxy-D-arabinonate dehydratase